MPYFDFNVEERIDVDEYLSACDSSEKQEIVDALKESGYIDQDMPVTNGRGYYAYEFEQAIRKLIANYYSLSKEQTDIIINLSKRF
jgi:ribosomal protein S8